MSARTRNRGSVVLSALLSVGCGWPEVEATPIPAEPSKPEPQGPSGPTPDPSTPARPIAWPAASDSWVSPVAAEVSQRWIWRECGRITPSPSATQLGHRAGQSILSLAISADGSLLVSSAFLVVGWRVNEPFGESTALWTTGAEGAFNVELSPDGRWGTVSGDVRMIFETTNGQAVRVDDVTGLGIPSVPCIGSELNFSPDGRFVAGKHYTPRVDVIETEHFSVVGSFPTRGCDQGIAFDGESTLVVAPDGGASLRDFTPLEAPPAPPASRNDDWVTLTRAPDGAMLETRCTTEVGCVTSGVRWNANAYKLRISAEGHWWSFGNQLRHLPSGEARTLGESVRATVFAPNGDIIGGDADGALVRFCRSSD